MIDVPFMRSSVLLTVALLLTVLVVWIAVGCTNEEADRRAAPTATATREAEPGISTATELPVATSSPDPTATLELAPTQPPVTNRMSCGVISGTAYLSDEERAWYQENCVVEEPPPIQQPPGGQQPPPSCHPSYVGACLDPNASDYDCAGGSGNGPYYTGPVQVIGPDVFDLDRDGDGYGCE